MHVEVLKICGHFPFWYLYEMENLSGCAKIGISQPILGGQKLHAPFRKLIVWAFCGWPNIFCTVISNGALGHQS